MSPTETIRSVVITGAGVGLGRELATLMARRGYAVHGTAMDEGEVADLDEATGGRATLQITDISDDEAVSAFADTVDRELGEQGLDLLINNAAILTPGPIEALPLDAIRREFEVNVFGNLATINAFLPALRRAKGRIVQISTMTASFPLPFNGPSGASKAAIEVFGDVYRAELHTSGVDFVLAIPGNMLTSGPEKTKALLQELADGLTAEQQELYGPSFAAFSKVMNDAQFHGLPAADAAQEVLALAEHVPASSRVAVGKDAEQALKTARVATDAEMDQVRLQMMGLAQANPNVPDPMAVNN